MQRRLERGVPVVDKGPLLPADTVPDGGYLLPPDG